MKNNMKLVSQQYRAWSDCTDVLAGLDLYWWQRLLLPARDKGLNYEYPDLCARDSFGIPDKNSKCRTLFVYLVKLSLNT